MSEHGAKTPVIDSGYEDKQSSNGSNGHDERYVYIFGTSGNFRVSKVV
jgi:hypothetical protein